jgi:molybdopterin molybdotransferase
MLSVEQALEKLLDRIETLGTEKSPILECLGQVLAEDVYSDINVPPLDNSAYDGYAARAADIAGADKDSPRILRVIGTIMAGQVPEIHVEAGTTVRIMTGAPVPRGANCVIKFEDTDELIRRRDGSKQPPTEIGILREVSASSNVRPAGESVARGELVLSKGTVIRPSEVGVLASIGRVEVLVIRRPVVAILATGNEVVAAGGPLPEGKIYNSNSYSVAAQVRRYGCIPKLLGIVTDEEDSVASIFGKLEADMLITIGGVSMGDYDLIRDVMARHGEVIFWKVRMKPGKPLNFNMVNAVGADGVAGKIPHLGLAGNPVSCMVNFEVFGRSALLKMMGRKNLEKPVIQAEMVDHIKNKDGRRIFARVLVEKRDGKYYARLTGHQGSGILTSMTKANGLAIVPESTSLVDEGEMLKVMMLDWCEDL